MKWYCKDYNELSVDELYSILRVRQEVFIIEQNCNYLDADNYDKTSKHLMCVKNQELIAYMRIIPIQGMFETIYFGRILVKKEFRKMGLGALLINKGIELFSKSEVISMSAQLYLKDMYMRFGFTPIGEEYLEDNIPHIKMIRNG